MLKQANARTGSTILRRLSMFHLRKIQGVVGRLAAGPAHAHASRNDPAPRRHVTAAIESTCLDFQRHSKRAQAERIVREAAARPGEGPCLVWAA